MPLINHGSLRAFQSTSTALTGHILPYTEHSSPDITWLLYKKRVSPTKTIAGRTSTLSGAWMLMLPCLVTNEYFWREWSKCSGSYPFVSSPFGPILNITSQQCNTSIHDRYLLLATSLLSQRIWIHVVYAPFQLSERITFLKSRPTNVPQDVQHIVLGDFNIPLDPTRDSLHAHPRRADLETLLQWTVQLGIIDTWRTTHPSIQEFTGLGRRNRIDYCFLSTELFQSSLTRIEHDHLNQYHRADQLPVTFSLQHLDHPKQSKQTWKCPIWLFQVPEVQATLEWSLQ